MKPLARTLVLFLFAVPALAAEPATIGYVDMDKVIKDSDMGREAYAALEEKFGPKREAFAKEEQAIIQLQQRLGRDQALMSEAELEKRKGEIKDRAVALQKQVTDIQREVDQEQNVLGGKILEVAQEVITEIAKEQKLSAIYERTRSGLVYIDDNLNLTDEVIRRINAKAKSGK